jgi:hypothetical protein
LVAWVYRLLGLRQRPLVVRLAWTVVVPVAATLLLVDPLGDIVGVDTPVLTNLLVAATTAVRWVGFGLTFEAFPKPTLSPAAVAGEENHTP